ncbi:F0F1 ATP synthase subunit A [Anaerosalibacter bizertensis]|uniref:ATP synthase subunit a n=1 Tax=Anaerosalibacter bizertensis TaxID=932217 RepID=A0A844FH87_9FIRM|nr:F0F1 ATP synthase subunit A [Anaerosalibacter bizertensis]MBV1819225.1 F0F1 ATP synthase subunit A [Bacteroidales bacterium MSK.15.36]MBU5293082.1 F0F1 ATP synthase subunit A [Anaerosalibacter bizertensis]MCB5559051.1 F0F1 ATP synthase subunit A [Anaerosalibacter bizertensis]MCG4564764.1 F0F1 ATP synthase subunit A [Anaerosalibacter bizertensis]MCG4583041.1 F0F1 ATP synthase subunit A [Anaerosalibacter bizertensis]
MKIEIPVKLFGKDFLIPDTIVNSWIILIILTIFALIVNSKIKKAEAGEKPSGLLNVVEALVEFVDGLVKSTMGPDKMFFAPYILTLIMFLLVANLFGLIGFTPPTSDYSVTFTLALMTFFLTQYYSFKTSGFLGYFKNFTEPMAFLTPLNIIGELANPISLSFRLFGNILSGVIIMGLLYSALGYFAPILTPVLHAYFDVFSGVLQTFIFAMLTMIFVGGAMD